MSIRRIVVGVDGGERSYRALTFGAGLARREGAALDVCYVAPYVRWQSLLLSALPMLVPFVLYDPIAAAEAERTDIAQDVTAEAAIVFNAADLRGEVFVRTGDVVEELSRLADERDADLIVVGTPRRARLRSAGVVSRLTRGSDRGLLVAP